MDRFLEPFIRSARQCLMIRTDTTLDQTEELKATVYVCTSLHCRVIVNNKCEFQHSSSHMDCNFDARLVSKTRKYRSTKKLRKHVCQLFLVETIQRCPSLVSCISTNVECLSEHQRLVYIHSLVPTLQVSALPVIARLWGTLPVIARSWAP